MGLRTLVKIWKLKLFYGEGRRVGFDSEQKSGNTVARDQDVINESDESRKVWDIKVFVKYRGHKLQTTNLVTLEWAWELRLLVYRKVSKNCRKICM